MPTKQAMMDLGSTEAILEYANANHGVREKVINFAQLSGTAVRIKLCLVADEEDTFDGEGASKLEATADAVSTKFPA
jgi:hypothetical protein